MRILDLYRYGRYCNYEEPSQQLDVVACIKATVQAYPEIQKQTDYALGLTVKSISVLPEPDQSRRLQQFSGTVWLEPRASQHYLRRGYGRTMTVETAFIGLLGVVLGVVAKSIYDFKNLKQQTMNSIVQEASRASVEEYKLRVDLAKHTGQRLKMRPLPLHIYFNVELLTLVNGGDLKEETLKALHEKYERADDAYWAQSQEKEKTGFASSWDYEQLDKKAE